MNSTEHRKNPLDAEYSCIIKPPKKKRKKGIPPAPAPANRNFFQVHTPPGTPTLNRHSFRRRFTSPQRPVTPPRFSSPTATLEDSARNLFEACTNLPPNPDAISPLKLSPPDRPPTPPLEPTFQNDDVTYERQEGPSIPDQSDIKIKADRYYPILLGQYAPAAGMITECAAMGCSQVHERYYSCVDCHRIRWYCSDCMVSRHLDHPTHRIERWDTAQGCKIPTSLADLGLVLDFDHPNGLPCNCGEVERSSETITVMHTNGLHKIVYRVCTVYSERSAGKPTASPEQLLANRLWPATDHKPEQAYTFEALQNYDVMGLYGDVNIKQFCDALLALGPTGKSLPRVT
jgi:hypothetical protein